VTVQLPKPPAAAQYKGDPDGFMGAFEQWATRLVSAIERDSRDVTTPAKAVVTISNTTNTTTLDGSSGAVIDVEGRNFSAGIAQTLIDKGILRSKASDP
jgi:hypothetical protein